MVIDGDDVLRRLSEASDEFTVRLRTGDGFDETAYETMRTALRDARDAWRHEAALPKHLVAILLDLAPAIWSSSHLYKDGDIAERARQASDEIADLALQITEHDPA